MWVWESPGRRKVAKLPFANSPGGSKDILKAL